jgi:hypothetical protein
MELSRSRRRRLGRACEGFVYVGGEYIYMYVDFLWGCHCGYSVVYTSDCGHAFGEVGMVMVDDRRWGVYISTLCDLCRNSEKHRY